MRDFITIVESLSSALEAIVAKAQSLGMTLQVEEDAGVLYLIDIRRNRAPRGSGATIIRELLAYADQHSLEIMLDAENGSEGLIEYYEKLGFKLEQDVIRDMEEEGEDFSGPWVMWRIPQIS